MSFLPWKSTYLDCISGGALDTEIGKMPSFCTKRQPSAAHCRIINNVAVQAIPVLTLFHCLPATRPSIICERNCTAIPDWLCILPGSVAGFLLCGGIFSDGGHSLSFPGCWSSRAQLLRISQERNGSNIDCCHDGGRSCCGRTANCRWNQVLLMSQSEDPQHYSCSVPLAS